MPDFDTLIWSEPDPGVALITLNRPPMNPVTIAMLDEIQRAMAIAADDDKVRAVIFTGQGDRAFSAGADMDQFHKLRKDAEEGPPLFFNHGRKADLSSLETLPKPVISAINGVAVGEGIEIAMASDFRIAARSARLGFPEANIGVIPASGGCSRIVKLIGLARSLELVLEGDVISAEEAARIGLVTRVVDDGKLMDESIALARKIAKKAPLAVGMAKAVLRASANTDTTTAHALEMVAQTVLLKTQDHHEGVAAFLEKRRPGFTGR